MKKLIKCIIKFFSNNEKPIQAFHETEFDFRKKFYEEQEEQRNAIEVFRLNQFIGKPVIVVSNEWERPMIGVGVKIDYITKAMCPILVVKSYIDNQEYLVFGKLFTYSDLLFSAMYCLTPNQILLMTTEGKMGVPFTYSTGPLPTHCETVVKLNENGFYEFLSSISTKEEVSDN